LWVVSAMGQPTRPSIPSGRSVSSHPCNYMHYGDVDIKRQTRAACGFLSQVSGRGFSLRPTLYIGCTPALSVTHQRRCSCGVRLVALYKCYVRLLYMTCPLSYCIYLLAETFITDRMLLRMWRNHTHSLSRTVPRNVYISAGRGVTADLKVPAANIVRCPYESCSEFPI